MDIGAPARAGLRLAIAVALTVGLATAVMVPLAAPASGEPARYHTPPPGTIAIGPLHVDLRKTVGTVLRALPRVSVSPDRHRPVTTTRRPSPSPRSEHRPRPVRTHRSRPVATRPAKRSERSAPTQHRRQHPKDVARVVGPRVRGRQAQPRTSRTTTSHPYTGIVGEAIRPIVRLGPTMLMLIGASTLLALLVLALLVLVGRRPDPRVTASANRLKTRADW